MSTMNRGWRWRDSECRDKSHYLAGSCETATLPLGFFGVSPLASTLEDWRWISGVRQLKPHIFSKRTPTNLLHNSRVQSVCALDFLDYQAERFVLDFASLLLTLLSELLLGKLRVFLWFQPTVLHLSSWCTLPVSSVWLPTRVQYWLIADLFLLLASDALFRFVMMNHFGPFDAHDDVHWLLVKTAC